MIGANDIHHITSHPTLGKCRKYFKTDGVLDNKPVKRKTTVKNLAVLMDETFTWTPQVNKMMTSYTPSVLKYLQHLPTLYDECR